MQFGVAVGSGRVQLLWSLLVAPPRPVSVFRCPRKFWKSPKGTALVVRGSLLKSPFECVRKTPVSPSRAVLSTDPIADEQACSPPLSHRPPATKRAERNTTCVAGRRQRATLPRYRPRSRTALHTLHTGTRHAPHHRGRSRSTPTRQQPRKKMRIWEFS